MGFIAIIINSLAVILGGVIGVIFKNRIDQKNCQQVLKGLGVMIAILGLSGGLKILGNPDASQGELILVMLITISLGTYLGGILKLDQSFEKINVRLSQKFKQEDNFMVGFMNAFLIFSVGAMAIIGGIDAGAGRPELIYSKSVIDGITSMLLASTMGISVIFSALPLFIYQGIFVVLGMVSTQIDPEHMAMLSFNLVGYVLLVCMGINFLLDPDKRFKIINMVPALGLVVLYYLIKMI